MNPAEIGKLLQEKFGAAVLECKSEDVEPYALIERDRVIEVMMFLRDTSSTAFDFLRSLAAVDYPADQAIEVVYLLFSYRHRHAFKIKVRIPREQPEISSVEKVWPAANWHEREAYDLVGINFLGHPDLRRILLPDDWKGHPLRKDYKEEESYHGVSTTREYLTGMPLLPTHPTGGKS